MTGPVTLEVPNATFRLIGGDPALDFVNSASWYNTPSAPHRDYLDLVGKERFVVAEDLFRWGVTAGVISARDADVMPAKTTLTRARTLRRAIHRLFKGVIEGWPAEEADLAAFDAELTAARGAMRLVPQGNAFRWEWRSVPRAEDRILWSVAQHAAELLTSPMLERIRECSGVECGWLFLDSTRNHSRRWCEMADCGNLAKVRRFRGRAR